MLCGHWDHELLGDKTQVCLAKAHEESIQLVREGERGNDSGARMRNSGAQGRILKVVQ